MEIYLYKYWNWWSDVPDERVEFVNGMAGTGRVYLYDFN